ncbi:MAG: TIGR00159 family protein [Clostridiales bacterium]|nr:TIGR00159 family protein [Clostridiales bacterium]
MLENFIQNIHTYFQKNIVEYIHELYEHPIRLILWIIDITIVLYLIYKFIKSSKKTRAWQLIKGIALYLIITAISSLLNLRILNYILTSVMSYGVIALIVIFQPELRRALEQLGTNKIAKFFGIEKDIQIKNKEDIYKIVVAVSELAQTKTGALIVLERDIKIQDILDTGVIINADVSPQILVNIFVPNTPLHDGAVVISENKIMAAACILPLSNDKDISKALGTRHRAAAGISKETDSIVIIVSEESGKVSVAKDGKLIIDIDEENLRKLLLDNIVGNEELHINSVDKLKQRIVNKKVK